MIRKMKEKIKTTVAEGVRNTSHIYEKAKGAIAHSETLPLYKDGCPKCKDKTLVTLQKLTDERICRCRSCSWKGRLRA